MDLLDELSLLIRRLVVGLFPPLFLKDCFNFSSIWGIYIAISLGLQAISVVATAL
jgi:hypothetical protein